MVARCPSLGPTQLYLARNVAYQATRIAKATSHSCAVRTRDFAPNRNCSWEAQDLAAPIATAMGAC
jgi:hypothetical protein